MEGHRQAGPQADAAGRQDRDAAAGWHLEMTAELVPLKLRVYSYLIRVYGMRPSRKDEMVADALSSALERHGFWHKGRLCLPFEAAMAAVLPRWFCDPEAKDTRRLPPGTTPERLAALVQRADADLPLFAAADRDLDALERLGWML